MADVNISRKRKSGSHSIIFELSDGEISPAKSPDCDDEDKEAEPVIKCLKTSTELNLESEVNSEDIEKNVTIKVCQEMVDGKREETSIKSGKREDVKEFESCGTVADNENFGIIGGNGKGNLDSNVNNIKTDIGENGGVITKCSTNINKIKDIHQEVDDLDDLVDSKYHIPLNNSQLENQSPIITITFNSVEAKELYELKFMEFITSNFLELSPQNIGNSIEIFKDEVLESTEWVVLDEEKELKELSPKSKKRKHKSKVKKELFTVDTIPSNQSPSEYLPMYKSKYEVKDVLEILEEETKFVSNRNCFNCEGNHNLRDCPIPKDFSKINNARQQFKVNTPKGSRYHEEQKFGHLMPGRLSDNLRNALGLSKFELPAHIYKMRVLGYPPGWLNEAKVMPSDLAVFDIEGNNLKNKSAGKESIDDKKVIDYPGFNVPMETGSYDQNMRHGVAPYSKIYSKEAMITFYNKKQKLVDNLEICDMDMDNSDNEPTPPGDSKIVEDTPRKSPSLVDLESQKEELLAQLVTDNTTDSEILVLDDSKTEKNAENNDVIVLDDSVAEIMNHHESNEIDENFLNTSIKNSIFGTPIIKSSSPYSRLPNPDNFSKDVSPVINFENLPNSTGKYEQMTEILDKVRKALKPNQEKT